MKICLYSPYVPQHVGGGEKYFFDVARVLSQKHDVFVMVPTLDRAHTAADIRQKYEAFLGVSLEKVEFIRGPLGTNASWWRKLLWTRQFDVLYYLTDGSLFFSLAKRNIVHIQIPFTQPKTSLIDRLKLANWQIKNTNSFFTKQVVEKAWHTTINAVHWPMVEISPTLRTVDLGQKQPIILHVGRFFKHLHSKRQDVLVQIFKKLADTQPTVMTKWKLFLIGSIENTPEDRAYAESIHQAAQGYSIEFLHTASRDDIWHAYQQASLYWHATGYDVNQEEHPEKMEHFGISTVEAMALGCAPVVIKKGGQPEVVGPDLTDLLWTTSSECQAITLQLLTDAEARKKYQEQAITQAQTFNQRTFSTTLQTMIGSEV